MSPSLSVSAQSEFDAWAELQETLSFPEYAEASADLAKATAAYNATVGETRDRVNDSFQKLQDAVTASTSDTPPPVGELVAQVEASRLNRGIALQQLMEHWQQREKLAEQARAEFAKRVAPAQKRLAEVRDKADKSLHAIGCSFAAMAEAMPAVQIAEERFTFVRENCVASVVAARAADADARNLENAALEQVTVSRQGKEATKKFVTRLISKLAAA